MSRQWLVALLLGMFTARSYAYSCPPPGQPYAICNTTRIVLYVIDTSDDLSYTQIAREFDWIRDNILVGTPWNGSESVAFYYTYGANSTSIMLNLLTTKNAKEACDQVNALQLDIDEYGIGPSTLLSVFKAIENNNGRYLTNLILFSASKNAKDIDDTTQYVMENFWGTTMTVIALNGAPFPNSYPWKVIQVHDLGNASPDLGPCIVRSICTFEIDSCIGGFCPGEETCINDGWHTFCCNDDSVMPFPTVSNSTSAATTSTPHPTTPSTSPTTTSTPRSTTSTRGPTATSASPPITSTSAVPTNSSSPTPHEASLQCQCDYMTTWVDMIFLFDSSASTGPQGLDEMWSFASTMLDFMNIQKSDYTGTNYNSRVGIITYGNDANVLYPLGSLNNDIIDNLFYLPFTNDPRANLEAGIQAAVVQFDSLNHRANARKVMIVMATVFNPSGENAPNNTATAFKEEDGVVIVYNYVPEHGIESKQLASIASPGYFFSNLIDSSYLDLADGLCDANCFCRDHEKSFKDNSRLSPTAGCYSSVNLQSNFPRARNNCLTNYHNATIVYDESAEKTNFLKQLCPNNPFYIGLVFDITQEKWLWPDGSSPGSYQPWAKGSPPDGRSNQCAFVDSDSNWHDVDCRNGYYYICETTPCDSSHYCA